MFEPCVPADHACDAAGVFGSLRAMQSSLACVGFASLIACGGGSGGSSPVSAVDKPIVAGPTAPVKATPMPVSIRLLSSAPQWVSGGDARIEVQAAPDLQAELEIWINGQKTSQALVSRGNRLEGVVSGFVVGDNTLEVRHAHGQGLAGC